MANKNPEKKQDKKKKAEVPVGTVKPKKEKKKYD